MCVYIYISINMDNLLSSNRIFVFVMVVCMFSTLFGQDCFMYVKVSETRFVCLESPYQVFYCSYGSAIPDRYVNGTSQPCVCRVVPLPVLRKICPFPEGTIPTLYPPIQPLFLPPALGTIGHAGCPDPMKQYRQTRRYGGTPHHIPITGALRFRTAEDECKYHCLSVGTCVGIMFDLTQQTCLAFTTDIKQAKLSGSTCCNYYERECCTVKEQQPPTTQSPSPLPQRPIGSIPGSPTPLPGSPGQGQTQGPFTGFPGGLFATTGPMRGKGLVLQSTTGVQATTTAPRPSRPQPQPRQPPVAAAIFTTGLYLAGYQKGGQLFNPGQPMTIEMCVNGCQNSVDCAGTDYDVIYQECWIHEKTSCSSHMETTDPNPNLIHWKRFINQCP